MQMQIRSVLTPGWVKDEEQEERQKEEREGRKRGNGQKKKIMRLHVTVFVNRLGFRMRCIHIRGVKLACV